MSAAQEADTADAAVGNVTGSNSVNVFLGLGLPWVIGAIYAKNNSENGLYKVPSGPLGFSVLIFMICNVLCVSILVTRRAVSITFLNFRQWEESLVDPKTQKSFLSLSVSVYGFFTLLCQ